MPARNFQRLGPEGSAFLNVPMRDAAEVRASGSKRRDSQFNQSNRPATFRMKSIHDILPEMHRPDEIFAFLVVGHLMHKSKQTKSASSHSVREFSDHPCAASQLGGFECERTPSGYIIFSKVSAISDGVTATPIPASLNASILAAAVPFPPLTIAPACPIRR